MRGGAVAVATVDAFAVLLFSPLLSWRRSVRSTLTTNVETSPNPMPPLQLLFSALVAVQGGREGAAAIYPLGPFVRLFFNAPLSRSTYD